VLVPTIIGKTATTYSKTIADFVKKYKVELGLFSTANLACIVWQTLSGARATLLQQSVADIMIIIAIALAQHLIYLVFNTLLAWPLKLGVKEYVAVVIMSSQKSAPVAVTVITYLTNDATQQGLFAIPGLCGQILQIFVGSFLVKFLSRYTKEAQD